jgi:hypothetical protein
VEIVAAVLAFGWQILVFVISVAMMVIGAVLVFLIPGIPLALIFGPRDLDCPLVLPRDSTVAARPQSFIYMGGDPIAMTQEQKQLFLDGLTAEEKVALRIGERESR